MNPIYQHYAALFNMEYSEFEKLAQALKEEYGITFKGDENSN